jgi:hypothetical protein
MYQYCLNSRWLISAALMLAVACKRKSPEEGAYPDKTFSPTRWATDSLGCLAYRERVHESLFKNEAYFLDKPYTTIVSLLGKPANAYREGLELSTLYYTVECTWHPGYQGEPGMYDASAAKMLLFDMRRDKCTNMSIIIP